MRMGGNTQLTRDLGRIFGGAPSSTGDPTLLDGFARRSDAAAFEALVDRHGPMVRGVCRRILPDGHDADDAFQATFVVLLRKGGRVEHPDRLAPWLHGVASRVALKARARAARSRARLRVWTDAEADAATAPPGPHADLGDVQALIDAEIARLPAKLRGVVVLCLVEGITYDEAAGRLGCPIGTVQSRLSRGRDLLRARLTRRGVAPSLALAAPDLAGPMPVPLALARRTLAVAAGRTVPPTLLALTRGVAPAVLSGPTILASLLLGGIALAGGGLTLARSGPAADPAQDRGMMPAPPAGRPPRTDAPPAQAPPAPAAAPVAITGRIIDLEGRPVAGVKVSPGDCGTFKPGHLDRWLAATRQGRAETPGLEVAWSEEAPEPARAGATTDADGRFRLAGFAPEAVVDLKLDGATIALSVVKVATRPIAPFPAPEFPNQLGPGTMTVYGSGFTHTATPGQLVTGVIRDARTGEPIAGAGVQSYRFGGSSYVGTRTIRVITDAQGRFRMTGLPRFAPATTGDRRNGNRLVVVPTDEQPYLMQEVDVPEPTGTDLVAVEVALHRGVWVEGKVADGATGGPVAGARLFYLPFLSNEFAQASPAFDRNGWGQGVAVQDRYLSRADGSFRLVGLPGRAIIGALTVDGKYLQGEGAAAIAGMDKDGKFLTYRNPLDASKFWPTALREVDPPADATAVHVDFVLRAGASVRVRVVDGSGRPVVGAETRGLGNRGNYDREPMATADGVVDNLKPGEERAALLIHAARKLGRAVRVRAGDDAAGPVVVALKPLATIAGRTLDPAGNPAAGVRVRADLLPGGDFSTSLPEVATDDQGRFAILNVAAGCDYALNLYSRPGAKNFLFGSVKEVVVRPGEATDVGIVRLDGDAVAAAPPPPTPAAEAVAITGRIIDLEGRPVAGVKVTPGSYQTFKQGNLAMWLDATRQGRPGWVQTPGLEVEWSKDAPEATRGGATTDAAGRFRIAGFGPEAVVDLKLIGDAIAFDGIAVATRPIPPTPAPGLSNLYGPGTATVYGSDFTYTAAPTRPVVGTVRDARTGEPLAGVGVQSYLIAGSDTINTGAIKTTADAQGRFRLVGLPRATAEASDRDDGNRLLIVPTDDQPYFVQQVNVPAPAGNDPIAIEVAAPRGVWIEGKITDGSTGGPVPGVRLHYLPFLANAFAQASPIFDRNKGVQAAAIQDRYLSQADGSFRLVGLPGRAIVGALTYDGKYLQGDGAGSIAGLDKNGHFPTYPSPVEASKIWPTSLREVDPPAGATTVHVDFTLKVGPSVRVRVVDGSGRPVDGVRTMAAGGRDSYDREPMAAEGAIRNLMPGEERMALLIHDGRKLGRVIRVREGDDKAGPITVALEPLATIAGRVVDGNDNTAPGALIHPALLPAGDFSLRLSQVKADEQGRFVVPDVAVGCDYQIHAEFGALLKDRRRSSFEKVVVRPGATTDLGDLRIKGD